MERANWNRRELALAALAAGCASGAASRDVIVHGGPIHTGVETAPRAEAVRIRDGRFVLVGSLADARSGAAARELDLRGATAFPGFNDAHVHLPGVGLAALTLDLVGVSSIAELQQRLRDYARANPEGPIVGRGWIETHWPERRFPNRADLDAVVSDRPVLLERIDGHAAVANASALALGQITNATPDPDGGAIERDESGAATGMLIDNAATLVQARLPAPSEAQKRQALQEAARLYASRGWTGVGNMSTSGEEAMLFLDFAASGMLPLSADIYMTPEDSEAVFVRGPFGMGRAQVRGVKLYMDGALGSRGAALLAPYSDAATTGLLVMQPEEIARFTRRARERRVQLATHAIGDRGNRLVLDFYRDAFADDAIALRTARWRIEHAQVIHPDDIPRFAAMGVIASMQPSHAISDLHFAPARLGDARLFGAYAWTSLLRSGASIAGGSDAPVEKGDPLIEFYAAVHRHDLNGFAGANWRLDERVARHQALAMFTTGPAYAAFSERERGTIEVGKRADLSCFSADLMSCAPADIPRASAVLTLCEGEVTHEAL